MVGVAGGSLNVGVRGRGLVIHIAGHLRKQGWSKNLMITITEYRSLIQPLWFRCGICSECFCCFFAINILIWCHFIESQHTHKEEMQHIGKIFSFVDKIP